MVVFLARGAGVRMKGGGFYTLCAGQGGYDLHTAERSMCM